MTLCIETDRLSATVDPAFGARVTSLTDKVTGREWLVQGATVPGDTYGGEQARGWDECFPTVLSCLHAERDHGELWGRPTQLEGDSSVWCGPGWRFTRRLIAEGASLRAEYVLENTGDETLDWMWSQHCLIAPEPGERLILSGFTAFSAGGGAIEWPHDADRDLSVCGGPSEGFAAKIYAKALPGPVTAAVEGSDGGISFSWDGAELPAMGLWLDWGGWPLPPDAPVYQLAIEPTTAAADDLDAAVEAGAAWRLPPGISASWSVRIRLTNPIDSERGFQ
jgi:hypothetical protein